MEKECFHCKNVYEKNPKYSKRQWERSKFCSQLCMVKGRDSTNIFSWNAGIFRKGDTPWNKDKKLKPPKICIVCGRKNYRVQNNTKYGSPLCSMHNTQYHRHGKILWVKRKHKTPLRNRIRHSIKNKNWREAVFKRDNYKCVKCGINGYLEADHYPILFSSILNNHKITSYSKAMKCKELWDINNGRTLCLKCHRGEKAKRPPNTWRGE